MRNKLLVVGGIVIGIFALLMILISSGNASGYETLRSFEGKMILYKSSTCGCCEVYSQYFKGKGNSEIEIVTVLDNRRVMDEYNIPGFLESCHTTVVGNYFVEGHIPLEAIEKLLTENPNIAGIGMPGMPSGSPGMPGPKSGDFVIYGVNYDGSTFEFMRI
ncbi:MAG: hypothetical protein KKB62_02575 [Nanoarchaeota archaeon]|nr:hypothetical protein [Nanoarchaeota archaeon]